MNIEDKFKFWCPLEKAESIDPSSGESIMVLGGIASTSDEDSDGEFLDPKGFDIQPLLNSGLVNWHHQAKGQPGTIIGEPIFAEIRPEGLYIKTKLYPSSKIACDVWELAETLEKDSTTRRLGYSIEGRVVERKSNDKNSPDFKRIIKAIITGVAVTHQPKNPTTFANIIKGEVDEFEEEEIEEAVDTESASALKKESLNNKLKNQTFSKSECIDRILKDLTSIDIEKAEQIYLLFKKIANMKGRKRVNGEDIEKAYQALGIESDSIEKAEDDTKDEVEETEDSFEESEDDYEEEDDEVEEDVKKGGNDDRYDILEKAITASSSEQKQYFKALGVMIKDVAQKSEAIIQKNAELSEIVKAQESTINSLNERLEAYGSEVPTPKSLSSSAIVERHFDKGFEDEFDEPKSSRNSTQSLSMSKNKSAVAEVLDQMAFSKGYDSEMGAACTHFEATKGLPANIIARIKNETGIEITK